MKTAFGVIGANYGDEGKGRNVDLLCAELGGSHVTVVRSNGGAQAGHTVVAPDGRRHVFHHVGSGSFTGAGTHLSRFFVHHPMTFMDEMEDLGQMGVSPSISADGRGFVTTPWDMMVNQIVETARGGTRHGSCGYGFGETVGRNELTPHILTLSDLRRRDLVDILIGIRDEWLPARLQQLGVVPDEDSFRAIASDAVLGRFVEDCRDLYSTMSILNDRDIGGNGQVVFEAAQGLLLDQRGRDFPHVTRSNTGIENMALLAGEAGFGRLEATYASRCYLTRHGAGPMPDERDLHGIFNIVDPTNVPNPWQSSIRHGLLDIAEMGRNIRADMGKAPDLEVVSRVAISCLDQVIGDAVVHMVDGFETRTAVEDFTDVISLSVGADQAIGFVEAGRRPETALAA